jgi:hypothetical protein
MPAPMPAIDALSAMRLERSHKKNTPGAMNASDASIRFVMRGSFFGVVCIREMARACELYFLLEPAPAAMPTTIPIGIVNRVKNERAPAAVGSPPRATYICASKNGIIKPTTAPVNPLRIIRAGEGRPLWSFGAWFICLGTEVV